jgi:hypothetical protein
VTGGWRKLHAVELHNFYSSPNIMRMIKSKRMRLADHVAHMGAKRNACMVLMRKLDGKRPLRRPRCRWEHNVKIGLRETGWHSIC